MAGSGVDHFVDRDSIRLREGLVSVWTKEEYHSPRSSDNRGSTYSYTSSKMLHLANCQERTKAIVSLTEFSSDGRSVFSYTVPREQFKHVVPGSVGAGTLDFACNFVRASTASVTPPPKSPPAASRTAPKQDQAKSTTSSGRGFAVDRYGMIVTNHHVIKGCSTFEVRQSGNSYPAQLVAQDAKFDLAILRTGIAFPEAALRNTPIAVGETICVAGFPLAGLLSGDMNFTNGVVASGAGIGSNFTQLQITAPVQQGNSGGPLLAPVRKCSRRGGRQT